MFTLDEIFCSSKFVIRERDSLGSPGYDIFQYYPSDDDIGKCRLLRLDQRDVKRIGDSLMSSHDGSIALLNLVAVKLYDEAEVTLSVSGSNRGTDGYDDEIDDVLLKFITSQLYRLYVNHDKHNELLERWQQALCTKTYFEPEDKTKIFTVQQIIVLIFNFFDCAKVHGVSQYEIEEKLTTMPLTMACALLALTRFSQDHARDQAQLVVQQLNLAGSTTSQLLKALPPVEGDVTLKLMREWLRNSDIGDNAPLAYVSSLFRPPLASGYVSLTRDERKAYLHKTQNPEVVKDDTADVNMTSAKCMV